jgi:hypothetical protein
VCAANVLGMRRPSKGRHANMFFTRTDTECPVWVGNPDVFESQVLSGMQSMRYSFLEFGVAAVMASNFTRNTANVCKCDVAEYV